MKGSNDENGPERLDIKRELKQAIVEGVLRESGDRSGSELVQQENQLLIGLLRSRAEAETRQRMEKQNNWLHKGPTMNTNDQTSSVSDGRLLMDPSLQTGIPRIRCHRLFSPSEMLREIMPIFRGLHSKQTRRSDITRA